MGSDSVDVDLMQWNETHDSTNHIYINSIYLLQISVNILKYMRIKPGKMPGKMLIKFAISKTRKRSSDPNESPGRISF